MRCIVRCKAQRVTCKYQCPRVALLIDLSVVTVQGSIVGFLFFKIKIYKKKECISFLENGYI